MHVICKHYAMLLDNVTMFVEFRLIAINGTISNAHQGHTFIVRDTSNLFVCVPGITFHF